MVYIILIVTGIIIIGYFWIASYDPNKIFINKPPRYNNVMKGYLGRYKEYDLYYRVDSLDQYTLIAKHGKGAMEYVEGKWSMTKDGWLDSLRACKFALILNNILTVEEAQKIDKEYGIETDYSKL